MDKNTLIDQTLGEEKCPKCCHQGKPCLLKHCAACSYVFAGVYLPPASDHVARRLIESLEKAERVISKLAYHDDEQCRDYYRIIRSDIEWTKSQTGEPEKVCEMCQGTCWIENPGVGGSIPCPDCYTSQHSEPVLEYTVKTTGLNGEYILKIGSTFIEHSPYVGDLNRLAHAIAKSLGRTAKILPQAKG